MPTTRPRYTVTDTGEVSEMIDLAQAAWPEISDRKELLLRLAGEGSDAVRLRLERAERRALREEQRAAWQRIRGRIDIDVLLSDEAWR